MDDVLCGNVFELLTLEPLISENLSSNNLARIIPRPSPMWNWSTGDSGADDFPGRVATMLDKILKIRSASTVRRTGIICPSAREAEARAKRLAARRSSTDI